MDIFAMGEKLLEKQKQKLEQEKQEKSNREFIRPPSKKEIKQIDEKLWRDHPAAMQRSKELNEQCEHELASDSYVMLDERTVQIWIHIWLDNELLQSTWWMKPHR